MQVGSTFFNKKINSAFVDMAWTSVFYCWVARFLKFSVLWQFFWHVYALEILYNSCQIPSRRDNFLFSLFLCPRLISRFTRLKVGPGFSSVFESLSVKQKFLLRNVCTLVSFCFIYANCDHWLDNSPNVSTEICRKRSLNCLYFVCHSELRYLNQNATFFLGI